jgi:putative flippase GtrA
MQRLSAFAAVGALGFAVQIAALAWLTIVWEVPYALATIAAVETAILHNFLWHERWTWADRGHIHGRLARLLRFHAGNGLVSLAGNLVVTVAGVELMALHPAAANTVAVVVTSIANFLLADRWVFVARRHAIAVFGTMFVTATPTIVSAAPQPETLAAWDRYVTQVESAGQRRFPAAPLQEPRGQTVSIPGGTIHEWRGSLLVHGITVADLVRALSDPGLPPPSEDVLDARVLRRHGDSLSVYLKVTRSAVVTATYDTEHDVVFVRHSDGFATSQSVATRIAEVGGGDRGFLWKLNSYWQYRQVGDAVQIDVLSLSLSRDVPAFARPIAGPLISRISRESMRRTLDAMDRFAAGLRVPRTRIVPAGAH